MFRRLKNYLLVVSGILLLMMIIPVSYAVDYPVKPIKLIVPLPPGGPVDAVARELGKYLTDEIGQTVVIENISGAYGQIGLSRLNRASADGYTFAIAASGMMVLTPLMDEELPYDTIAGFTPISLVSEYTNVLVSHPDLEIDSLEELEDLGLNTSEDISFASSGYGASNHLAGELLNQYMGIEMLHIPFKGTAPARTEVIAGRVDVMFDVISSATPFIESGKLKAIATTGRERHPSFPDIPAISEYISDYEVTGWFALFGPPGLDSSVIKKIQAAVNTIYDETDFPEFLIKTGYEPVSSTSEQLLTRIHKDFDYWKPVVEGAEMDAEP